MTAAVVASATVISAGMTAFAVLVVMMATSDIRVVAKIAGEQCLDCGIAGAEHAAVESDPCHCQRHLCTAADTSANQYVCVQVLKNGSESAVSSAVGINDGCVDDFFVFHIIDLELVCVAIQDVSRTLPVI